MEPITCGRRIHHRAIAHYFDSYSPAAGLYVPNRKLRFESLHPFFTKRPAAFQSYSFDASLERHIPCLCEMSEMRLKVLCYIYLLCL